MNQPRPAWELQGAEKRHAVREMFGQIAGSYDRANAIMSGNRHRKWREIAASKLELKPGQTALDLCCGTGDFLPILREKVGSEGKIFGLDFCAPMLAQAGQKDQLATLSLADATQVPMASESVDAVSVGWGIRNVPDIDAAHREIARVLRPGGKFVSIDCSIPRNPIIRFGRSVVNVLLMNVVGTIAGNRAAYKYLDQSTIKFKSREELASSMASAGFKDIEHQDLMFGTICIHWGTKS